ncbi:hypothetical protein [Paractinoplanes atraurantiacus]|uniref:Uncharacterized protein n=1 Tax=Paractinoplanes atraurantiacus TaxID=1036182 RepID=A0A285JFZ0_9ACTN|nr:hypothetical protein [Actinoplanes atraurantiacus]SNY59192.1 hypothetical protein SAMN05421748_12078 [Actinoplanes atraurantiacus]
MARKRRAQGQTTPRAVGRVAGRVRVGRVSGRVPPIDRASTEVAHFDEAPRPVFHDPAGGRRRRLRIAAYVVGLALLVLLLAFWFSQLSGGVPQ